MALLALLAAVVILDIDILAYWFGVDSRDGANRSPSDWSDW